MRLIIVSNRAPVTVTKTDDGYTYQESSGGLASGLRAYVDGLALEQSETEVLWVGWPGMSIDEDDQPAVREVLQREFGVHSVFLPEEETQGFYEGFSNSTLWPLFHYFQSMVLYRSEDWAAYQLVNRHFADELAKILRPDDTIWIHDYHLMLLPALVRARAPEVSIGFFLHIPFPSYEVFRLLPSKWRRDLLSGLLGADLIGFHTHDYREYFLGSLQRILGISDEFGEVMVNDRLIKTGVFPMGIDAEKFRLASGLDEVVAERELLRSTATGVRLILSLDRQDYTKGILQRLDGYEHFLESNPAWIKRVTMVMVVVPSRTGVEDYQEMKSRIDERIGNINGNFGTIDWTPIIYQYRSVSFEGLVALYSASDVALVTPVRDGMNLVSKEYVASRQGLNGVLILSETTGAANELTGALLVNPNHKEDVAEAITSALEMPQAEQARRMLSMHERVSSYTVFEWVSEFLGSLGSIKASQHSLALQKVDDDVRIRLIESFQEAPSRLLFLDYDGTLRGFTNDPSLAKPSHELIQTLRELARLPKTQVVLISGRDRATLEKWFGGLGVGIAAEHGLYLWRGNGPEGPVRVRVKNVLRSFRSAIAPVATNSDHLDVRATPENVSENNWEMLKPVRSEWKDEIRAILEDYLTRLPGAMIEEKDHSIAFHYRAADPRRALAKVNELAIHLRSMLANLDLNLLMGNNVLEVRNAGIDKGVAAMHWLSIYDDPDTFVMAVGDDPTDEDMFRVMPRSAWSIKVGDHPSAAKYCVDAPGDVLGLLEVMANATIELHPLESGA